MAGLETSRLVVKGRYDMGPPIYPSARPIVRLEIQAFSTSQINQGRDSAKSFSVRPAGRIRDTTAERLSISFRKAGKRRHAICKPGPWPRELQSLPAPSCII